MQTEHFELFQCWDADRISQVINKEAASVDRATFLATHAPLNKLTYERSPYSIADTSENGLLNELRKCATEQRHAFAVVLGIPGTGKSHLIRWLQERYAFESEQQECVLFIERAQCSLSGTLEQIIKFSVFDDEVMHEQLKKLKGATVALSDHALTNTLLDQIRITAGELEQPTMPRWLSRNNKFEMFFLDFTVRRTLMMPDGPIERIRHFLSHGLDAEVQSDRVPKFEARDFDFKPETLRAITGYEEALEVAQRLFGEEGSERREELANYLNHILPYAIGRAMTLTSDDFKRIFYDVRRYLREQGRQLTLFIEDITVLTGIDVGLLDVLATQHTGESSQEFCRLISVVGITDSYFTDYFPQNMKDRVTHRVTLNAMQTTLSDSELLSDSSMTADMAARYLNAIRLDQRQLNTWLEQGARPEQMPNACDTCRFRATCHAAFSAKKVLVGNNDALYIGLYPFNEAAIWNFYQHINTVHNKRTPRSLLNNIISYILQSHGSKIKLGLFPPAPAELGGEFTTFSLAKPLQRNLIEQQGGIDAKRIETLVNVWGDATIDASQNNDYTLIGGLASSVFQAFGIKQISGERSTHLPTKQRASSQDTQSETMSPRSDETILPGKNQHEVSFPIPKNTTEKQSEYVKDITAWLNGEKLTKYEDYNELLAQLIRTFIDWDFYGISSIQVDELFKGRRRIYIEDQFGKMNTTHYIKFKRSSELFAVLVALVEMKERNLTLEDAVLGGHLTNLSIWLHQQEEAIIQFARQPNMVSFDSLPLTHILLLDCLLLACLQGWLQPSYQSTQQLFLNLIAFCVAATTGQTQPYTMQDVHSPSWAALLKRTQIQTNTLCNNLLNMLNCAQGGSSDVRFVDTTTALQVLDGFRRNHWRLPDPSLIDAPALPPWGSALTIYEAMQTHFAKALQDECDLLQTLLDRFSNLLGDAQPKEVFQAINNFVTELVAHNKGTTFELKRTLTPTKLNTVLSELRAVLHERDRGQQILRLSKAEKLITTAQEYLEYLEGFVKEAVKQRNSSSARLAQLQNSINIEVSSEHTKVKELYQEIALLFKSVEVKESIG